jgi:CspA family cold shock protein
MPVGTVKWFNAKKGYGFIVEDDTNKDIFLHVSELENSKLRVLKENQKIKFEILEENSKLKAVKIEKI